MRVGIITFHNGSNYGAALQAYALQEKVKDYYDNVSIINYKNPFIMNGLKQVRWGLSLHNAYFICKDILGFRDKKKKIDRFHNFFQKYYNLTELIDRHTLQTREQNWDLCISGSDQIWNPILNHGLDEIYFGQILGVKRRISYASSVGAYKFDNEGWNEQFKEYLNGFDKISVRENADKIQKELGIKILEVLDPTLLLSKKDWKRKLKIIEVCTKKYVLVYAMNNVENIVNYACHIAAQLDLEVLVIGKYFLKQKRILMIDDAGPIEFVELFYHASYIVTNSFHGTAFAINFHKQFSSISNLKSPERVRHLLENAGLIKHLKEDTKDPKINEISESEFLKTEKWLCEQRKIAEEFLKI